MMIKKTPFLPICAALLVSGAFVNGLAQTAPPTPKATLNAPKTPALIAHLPDSFNPKNLHVGDALVTPDKHGVVILVTQEKYQQIKQLEKTQGPAPTVRRTMLFYKNTFTPAVLVAPKASTISTTPIELSGKTATQKGKTLVWNNAAPPPEMERIMIPPQLAEANQSDINANRAAFNQAVSFHNLVEQEAQEEAESYY